jgi:excisionase family DNA binding protein
MARQPVGFRPEAGTTAVFARVPADAARKLDRAAAELRLSKGEIVGSLLSTLESDGELVLGHVQVPSAEPAGDVMTPNQLAELLQVDEATVVDLAERGELPGRRLGREWRFARSAVLAWLAG